MTSKPDNAALTLAWVNGLRQGRGLKPLDALPLNRKANPRSTTCPVALALFDGTAVGVGVAYLGGARRDLVWLPAYVNAFLRESDNALD